jgi:hypothetical protein
MMDKTLFVGHLQKGENMKKRVIVTIVSLLLVTGCAPAITQRYASPATNIVLLRELNAKSSQKIKLGEFEGDQDGVSCRLVNISPPDRVTFASFLKNAVKEDLMMADMYAENANVELTGRLVNIDVNCAIGTGEWIIEMEFTKVAPSSNEKFSVTNTYSFEGAYNGAVVFNNASLALVPAVQEFVKAVFSHPKFQSF